MTQCCKVCGETKSVSEFDWQKNRPNPRKTCKQCRYAQRNHDAEKLRHREYMRERRKNDPKAVRKNWENSVYGTTKEDLQAALGYSGCLICGSVDRLHIDHCHTTGKVRGLLCGTCNAGLGMFKDSPLLLKRAAEYLAWSKDGPHIQLEA